MQSTSIKQLARGGRQYGFLGRSCGGDVDGAGGLESAMIYSFFLNMDVFLMDDVGFVLWLK